MSATITPSETSTITELLSHLIRMPTITSDLATNRAALDWVEEQLKGLPLHIKRPESNGFSSLIATTQDTRQPRLWLQGHIDVVPGDPEVFQPQIRNGRLYGRGAYDMKFAIALFIALLQELGDDLPKYDIGLMLTSDEEVSGANGVGWLVSQGYLGKTVLLPDSGPNWGLETGAKGAFFWKFKAQGKAAHGSRIWQGENAIDRLYQFLEVLKSNMTKEPCGDENHIHNTLNVGSITGGTGVPNQVADTAEALVDLRLIPTTTSAQMNAWIKAAEEAVPGVVGEQLPMFAEPYTMPAVGSIAIFRKIAEAAIGRTMPEVLAHGSSDARWFATHGISVITTCPLGGDHHGANEWIDIEDLNRYYQVMRQFVNEYAIS